MSNFQIYFGTKATLQWITAPSIDVPAGKMDWNSRTKLLNGGNYVRRSATAAREYAFTWSLRTRDQLRPILDYADGLYGSGFFYYLDPFQQDRNVLPQYWASPYLNSIDGPLSTPTARPALTDHVTSTNGYPSRSGGITGTKSIFIPVPPGYTLYAGIHVDASITAGGSMAVKQVVNGVRTGTNVTLTNLNTSTTTRTNATFVGGTNTGYEFENSADIRYTGMIAQVLPTGSTVPTGGFISGQGHCGLSFAQQPEYYEYSSGLDRVRAAAVLVEEEAWV